MDFRHVARLSEAHHDLAEQLAESDRRGDMELAESLRPTLKHALESLKLLYDDDDLWRAAAQAVTAANAPTRQLIEKVANYPESLPALLELFGYLAPPPAAQLVSNAVASLQAVPADEGPAAAIDAISETRQALGQLLEKTLTLEDAQPWLLPDIAAETTPALEMGVTFAAGALSGGVMVVIGAAIVPAVIAGGGLAVAPLMIMGGIHWWRRQRRLRAQEEKLHELQEQLPLDLVPAARAAVLQHLDAIVGADQRAVDESPQALLDLSDHLQALIDITRRFGVSDSRLRTAARQRMLRGDDALAFDVLKQLPEVFAVAVKAKGGLDAGEQISQVIRAELERQQEVIRNLRSRHGKQPPSVELTLQPPVLV
jgi:hypothetical protein